MAEIFICDCSYAENTFLSDENLRELFGFFQLNSPFISSYQSREVKKSQMEAILQRMLKNWDENSVNFINPTRKIMKVLNANKLDQSSVQCKGKRFVVQKQNNSEEELVCLLRHIRNSLAHGSVFVKTVGATRYILFEDYKKSNCISAKIICTQKELERWKKIIERYQKK